MANRFWVGDGGDWSDNTNHWSTTSGGTAGASVPASGSNVYFDENSFTTTAQTVNLDSSYTDSNLLLILDWSEATNSPIFNINNTYTLQVRSLVLTASMTFTSGWPAWPVASITGFPIIFYPSGQSCTVDTKGVSIPSCSTIRDPNYDTILLSDLVVDGYFMVSYGTGAFDANNFNVTCKTFLTEYYGTGNPEGDHPEIIPGTGTWTITGYNSSFTVGSNTYTAVWSPWKAHFRDATGALTDIASFVLNDSSTNNKTLDGTASVLISFTSFTVSVGGTGNVQVYADDINNMVVNYFPGTLKFYSVATAYNIDTFVVNNTSATQIQVITNELSTSLPFHMTKSSGRIEINYCDISYSHVGGGAEWYACHCTDSGENDGWTWACYTETPAGGLGYPAVTERAKPSILKTVTQNSIVNDIPITDIYEASSKNNMVDGKMIVDTKITKTETEVII